MITSTHKLTVADLMGDDHNVWLQKNTDFGYDIHIEGYDNPTEISEENIHPFAVDSFANFCRKFLNKYDQLNRQ